MSPHGYGCHCWGHVMKGKWSTTVSPWALWNTNDYTERSVQESLVAEDQRQPGDHLELLLALDVARWGMRGSANRGKRTVPLIPILSFVRTQALWLRKLLYFHCDIFSAFSVTLTYNVSSAVLQRGGRFPWTSTRDGLRCYNFVAWLKPSWSRGYNSSDLLSIFLIFVILL